MTNADKIVVVTNDGCMVRINNVKKICLNKEKLIIEADATKARQATTFEFYKSDVITFGHIIDEN